MSNKPWAAIPAAGPIVRTADAAAYVGMSKNRYYELAAAGEVPPIRKISQRASGVPKSWLDAYILHCFTADANNAF